MDIKSKTYQFVATLKMAQLPEYIQALVNTSNNGVPGAEVRTIPFSRTFKVARLPSDHIIVCPSGPLVLFC